MKYGIFDVLTLLGSLGLFLYGMKVMSDGLMQLAGDKMRRILAGATSNRFFAVFTGFIITALIQSSSATTLMVVSFANASLLTLTEAIGVIMGANIGTTVTAWLISILGFKVSMSAIAIPLVGLGFVLSLAKDKQVQYTGRFVIGFAVLLIGLQFLKDSVPDLRESPEALEFLAKYTSQGFVSVLLFLFIGTLLTVILQSSSATMALTLVMCFEGWIPFDMAAAMVLGENIGTTITANIAALVGNYQAKRAARAHFIFNIFGVLWMLLVFWLFLDVIDLITQKVEGASPLVQTAAIPVALSLFHTSFNIINTSLLIGLIPLIGKTVQWLVPKIHEKSTHISEPKYLDKTSLKYPQSAIKALLDESLHLYEKTVYKVVTHGLNVHREEIESDLEIKDIILNAKIIEIDVERVYLNKFKNIYGRIVEYATTTQEKFALDETYINAIQNILKADRLMVNIIKDLKPLRDNINTYGASDNPHIKQQYNRLRKLILQVVRYTNIAKGIENLEEYMQKSTKLKEQIDKTDVLLDGTINQLLREKKITNKMATSLLNDNSLAVRISHDLLEAAALLYLEHELFAKKEHEEEPQEQAA